MTGTLVSVFGSCVIVLSYDFFKGSLDLGVRATCCSQADTSLTYGTKNDGGSFCDLLPYLGLNQSWILDLNKTFFINSVILGALADADGSIDVDIGTTSCATFEDLACYVTCSSRDVVEQQGCHVIVNVTCDVDNVKGRYVRVRHNNTGFALCDVTVMGWPEVYKGTRNYALNAPCTQSSLYSISWAAAKAVDGNRDGHMSVYSCAHTSLVTNSNTDAIHWWQVDMRKLILVSHIIIANRVDSCCNKRLFNFTVHVGRLDANGNMAYTLCRYFDGVAGELTTLNCTRSVWGQFVRISKTGMTLTLCEVEVYGDADNDVAVSPEIIQIVNNFSCNFLAFPEENTASIRTSEVSTLVGEPTIMTSWGQKKFDQCLCQCEFGKSKKHKKDVQQEVTQTAKELQVERDVLAKQVRKKSSAADQRLSSATVGIICTAAVCSIFAAIVACDFCSLLKYLHTEKSRAA